MKKHFIIIILVFIAFAKDSQAQKIIRGVMLDSAYRKPLVGAKVENFTTKKGTTTNSKGEFEIEVGNDSYLSFSILGYKDKIMRIRNIADAKDYLEIVLPVKVYQTKEVTITKKLTQYQLDSIDRAELYGDVFGYSQQKSVFSPITSLYQKFSRKYKNIRKFQEQIVEMEKEKFVDTRYTPVLVQKLTKLEGDDVAHFMNANPVPYDFARTASDLELNYWIKEKFDQYKNKSAK